MLKSMYFSTSILFFNLYSGYSGSTYIEDYFYALFDINLSVLSLGFYMLLDQDIAFSSYSPTSSTKDLDLPNFYFYKIRTHLSQKRIRFFAISLYSWFLGGLFFYLSFYSLGGIVNEHGYTDGIWTSGLLVITA